MDYATIPLSQLMKGVENIPVPESLWKAIAGQLSNTYVGLRHGESTANKAGLISSNADVGSKIHNLTPLGKVQARTAAAALIELLGKDRVLGREGHSNIIFISSNFTRARETAMECALAIHNMKCFQEAPLRDDNNNLANFESEMAPPPPVLIRDELRERYFGDFDAQPLLFYNRVWPIDSIDATNKRNGVESVAEVVSRISSLITSLENTFSGKTLILTSHADTLQIAQTFLAREDPRRFSEFRFANGEVRHLSTISTAPVRMVYK